VFLCARNAIFVNNYRDIITSTTSQMSELMLGQLTFLIQYTVLQYSIILTFV